MNLPYFQELAEYNVWANEIILDWLDLLSEVQWTKPIVSSFGSIASTTLHIAGAESVWFERLSQVETPVWQPDVFQGNKDETSALLKKSSHKLKEFVFNFEGARLHESISFKRLNGDAVTMSFYQIYAHVFNHSTYHRGQLVTMLRQVGFENVGSTDLLRYFLL